MEQMRPKSRHMAEFCVLYGEALGRYAFPDPHPFGSDRLPAFWNEFLKRGLKSKVWVESTEMCTEKDLLFFHTPEYIQKVRSASEQGAGYLDYGDTPAFLGVYEAACNVVGSTLKGLRWILEEKVQRAFTPIAGLHHARRERAGGFCVFNDIGVTIEYLRSKGIRKIGYVDIDAHHGDGVYYEYESDPELFIGDIHEDGRFLYPGTGFDQETGTGKAKGTKLNCPLPPGSGPGEFHKVFSKIEQFLDQAKPEFLLFQCVADSLAGCPLAHLRFTPSCHRYAAQRLRALADQYAGGRLLAMGGGGYDRRNIATAWCEVVEALI